MNESLDKTMDQIENAVELANKFDKLSESEVADSEITSKLFKSGQDGEDRVVKKIEEMNEGYSRDGANFRIAKLYYEHKNDLQTALNKINKIQNQDERTRCLVQLAVSVLQKEGKPDSADEIIKKVVEDNKGYAKYYEKVRKEWLENQKSE